MKLKSLFLASVAFAGLFSACSKDTDNTAIDGNNGESAYVQVGFSFPASMGSKAASTEDGLATEQSFSTIAIVIADKDNKVTDYTVVAATEFSPEGTGDKVYVSKVGIPATKQEGAKVYVFVNPTTDMSTAFKVGTVITGKEALANVTEQTGGIAKANAFLMSNTKGEAVVADIKGTKAAPTSITVKVDRVSAKLVENSVKTTFVINKEDHAINTPDDLTIVLKKYAYTNLNKSSYLLQNFEDVYTVDLNFRAPYVGADQFFFHNTTNKTDADYNFQTIAKGQVDYCLENTAIAAEQSTGKSTGIIYKADAMWAGQTAAATFYLYKNLVFTQWTALATEYNKEHETALTGEADYTFDQLKNFGITKYLDGACYYRTTIQHELTESEDLQPMEFAVVRNNVYKLNVNSIKSLGEPFIPTEDIPAKDKKTYIRLTVEVLPWTVRDNNFDF